MSMSAGELVTFIGYFDNLIWPLIALGQIIPMRSRAKTALGRISKSERTVSGFQKYEPGASQQSLFPLAAEAGNQKGICRSKSRKRHIRYH